MDWKNIGKSNNIGQKNKDIKNIIKRFINFEILLKDFLNKIESINNFYKAFSKVEKIKTMINFISNELREPILFELAVFLRSYIKDFEELLKLLKNNKDLIKLIEVNIRQKNKRIEEKFISIDFWDPKIMNPEYEKFKSFRINFYKFIWDFLKQNKKEKTEFEEKYKEIKGVLNVICHYYEENNHKDDKEKRSQYNEKLYSWILTDKDFQENFFEFIHWLDYVLTGKKESINSLIDSDDFLVIQKLTEYFNDLLKKQEDMKNCFDKFKNNK